ncbi:MAG: nucleoside hydrolase, partial [Thermomicrobiales bacterium]
MVTNLIHLDTDLGGDLDDLCALAMMLRWPEPIAITGITVVGDTGGRRTGMVRRVLEIAGRPDIPVAAGAETSGGYYPYDLGMPDEARYWETPITPSPNPVANAVELLKQSIEQGATIIGIGPYTNLRLLEDQYPGSLARVSLVLMGGFFSPPPSGYPEWTNADDFNVQVDVESSLR